MSESVLFIVEFDGKRLALPDWWSRRREDDNVLEEMESGVLIEDRRVGYPSEARQIISDLHQPGKKAVAVSFCTESVDTPERRKLLRRKRVLEGQILTVLKRAFDSLIGGKSPKVSCKKCGSSLAREYLKSVPCPVCGQEIASARRRERLEVLRSDLTVVDRLLGATPPEPKRTGPVRWLVGGWVGLKGGDESCPPGAGRGEE